RFDDDGFSLTHADAQGREPAIRPPLPRWAPSHLMDQRAHDPGSRASERMAKRYRPAVYVRDRMAEAELPHDREGLDGEGLVQFDQVEILHGEAGARQHLSSGRDGTEAHRLRLHARGRGGHDPDERSESKLLGLAIA